MYEFSIHYKCQEKLLSYFIHIIYPADLAHKYPTVNGTYCSLACAGYNELE